MEMAARFAAKKEQQSLVESNYRSYPMESGHLYAPAETCFTKETVTLGLEKFLLKTNITIDGIEKIDRS